MLTPCPISSTAPRQSTTRTRSRSRSTTDSPTRTASLAAGAGMARHSVERRGRKSSDGTEMVARNFGGGWLHVFAPTVVLNLRGGVATEGLPLRSADACGGRGRPRRSGLPRHGEVRGLASCPDQALGHVRHSRRLATKNPDLQRRGRPDRRERRAHAQVRRPVDGGRTVPGQHGPGLPLRRPGDRRPPESGRHRRFAGVGATRPAVELRRLPARRRHDPLPRPDLFLLRAGRVARQFAADPQLRPAVRLQPAPSRSSTRE